MGFFVLKKQMDAQASERFLEQDIQSSGVVTNEFLEIVESMKDGRQAEWNGTGNAHSITISPKEVSIENIWDDSLGIAQVSLDDFKQALLSWLACISAEAE